MLHMPHLPPVAAVKRPPPATRLTGIYVDFSQFFLSVVFVAVHCRPLLMSVAARLCVCVCAMNYVSVLRLACRMLNMNSINY